MSDDDHLQHLPGARPGHWQTSHEWEFNGTPVTPGTGITVQGSNHRYVFQRHVSDTKTGAEWIDLLEDSDAESLHFRAVPPELVTEVQRKSTLGRSTSSRQPSAGLLPAA